MGACYGRVNSLDACVKLPSCVYLDDSLGLLPSSSARVLPCLKILLACVLGVPLSWRNLYLSKQVRWIGGLFSLRCKLCAAVPEDMAA